MDDLKIIVDVLLDKNTEENLNKQIKALKIDPLKLNLSISNINQNESISQIQKFSDKLNDNLNNGFKINSNALYKNIISSFGIRNREIKKEIKEITNEYTEAFRLSDDQKIISKYNALFNSIREGLARLTLPLEDYEQDFLNHIKNIKFYVNDYLKGDFAKDEYKHYADQMIGKITKNKNLGVPIDTLYQELEELYPGLLPRQEELNHISEQFKAIVDKISELRAKKQGTDIENILWNFGGDEEIKNSLDNSIKNATVSMHKIKNIQKDTFENPINSETILDKNIYINSIKDLGNSIKK